MQRVEVAIIGGGIVGLATAYQLLRQHPQCTVLALEKEDQVARHQSGHNSGVLHSGIYYRPGSLKARICQAGRRAMIQFCADEGISCELCGKVIVAVAASEQAALDAIHERGPANGVRCEMIGPERLREIEPHAAGIRAIHVPDAGIVDFRQVCGRLRQRIEEHGGQVHTRSQVLRIRRESDGFVLETSSEIVGTRFLVNCAGLHSDRVAALAGRAPESRIVPFRGEFYELVPSATHLCRGLIYPVPDPRFPFLGVHFTRRIDGRVECGPNAVLALAREGYRKTDLSVADLWGSLSYPGFWRLATRYWSVGAVELWRSLSKRAFVRALQRLVPAIRAADLSPLPAGIRAQAVSPDGRLVDDFIFVEDERILNVCNAPSPAATASLEIGSIIAERISTQWAR